ncbi:MAG: NYN domain-containing protein [Deltaproteobacteria bacterium]|nr:MAG: NYN domain-containing protein [Deltaproteobacteria bacterium]
MTPGDSMRIGLFFDGANFYRSLDAVCPGVEIDYEALASWLVARIGGDAARLAGAWYYTGLRDQPDLERFLAGLERRTGFFVRRFPIADRHLVCPHCGNRGLHRVEKGVDTALVVDMLKAAWSRQVDELVLMSGDEDLRPGVEAAQEAGCPVWVASWAEQGLSPALRAAAYAHIDLMTGIEAFTTGRPRPGATGEAPAPTGPAVEEVVLQQIAVAAAYFEARGGYLARSYFERRWEALDATLPPAAMRAAVVERLVADGRVESYRTERDGRWMEAIRIPGSGGRR